MSREIAKTDSKMSALRFLQEHAEQWQPLVVRDLDSSWLSARWTPADFSSLHGDTALSIALIRGHSDAGRGSRSSAVVTA